MKNHPENSDDFFADTPIEKSDKEKSPRGKKTKTAAHPKEKSGGRLVYTIVIILAVITLGALAIWQNYSVIKGYFDGSYKQKNDKSLNDIISSTEDNLKNYDNGDQVKDTAPAQPVATAPAAIDKSTITISVLNGSGIKNSAQTVANALTSAGYSVSGTANARSFNYTKTFIYYKTDKLEQANLVQQTLSDRQTEVQLSNSVVGAKYDIVVVVGKN